MVCALAGRRGWRRHTLRRLRRLVFGMLLVGVGIGAPVAWPTAAHAVGDQPAPPRALTLGVEMGRELAPGEAHRYRVSSHGRQRLHATIAQEGIDVEIEVEAAGSDPWIADSPYDRHGVESLLLTTRDTSTITVRGREAGAPSGRYRIRLVEADPRTLDALRAWTAAIRNMPQATSSAWQEASALAGRASQLWTELGADDQAAFAGYAHAVFERLVDRPRTGLAAAQRARDAFRRLGETRFEAYAWNEIGLDQWALDHRTLDQRPAARDAFTSARTLGTRVGDDFVVAASASNLCLLTLTAGDLPRARDCYRAAMPEIERAASTQTEGAALTNLGRIAEQLGEPAEARASYGRAIDAMRRAGDSRSEARTRNNLGVLERGLGNLESAMNHYRDALAIFESLGDRRWQARALGNLGMALRGLGEYPRAETSFRQALAIFRDIEDARGEAIHLDNLGLVDQARGQFDAAVDRHGAALAIRRRLGHRRSEAVTLRQLAEAEIGRGRVETAITHAEAAVAISLETGDRLGEIAARHLLGDAIVAIDDLDETRAARAWDELRRALVLAEATERRWSAAQIHVSLARLARAKKSASSSPRPVAMMHAEQAIDILESMRTGLVSRDLRTAFSRLLNDAYALVIDLTMAAHDVDPDAGHAQRALGLAERTRSRTLLDARGATGVEFEMRDPTTWPARRDLLESLRAKTARLDDPKLDARGRQALEAARVVALQRLDAIDAHAARSTRMARAEPLGAEGMQDLIDPGTVVGVYFVGDARSYLWRITHRAIDAFTLPGRDAIAAAVDDLHRRMRTLDIARRADDRDAATRLATIIRLGDLVGGVDRDTADRDTPDRDTVHRLVLVPHDALHLVPFAALPVPAALKPALPGPSGGAGGNLVDRFEMVSLPSLSVLGLGRRLRRDAPTARTIAVIASEDGEGGDESLPASRFEAETVLRLAASGTFERARRLAPRRASLLADDAGVADFDIVHFATHGVVDIDPSRSGLVLSATDFLSLPEIYGLDLDAELVVLSGCETAVGPRIGGEGLIGLARGFLHAGARRVIASLWRVDDRATAALMSHFYSALATDGVSPSAALANAQRTMARSRRFRDPFYWAGFVHIGDWRAQHAIGEPFVPPTD